MGTEKKSAGSIWDFKTVEPADIRTYSAGYTFYAFVTQLHNIYSRNFLAVGGAKKLPLNSGITA